MYISDEMIIDYIRYLNYKIVDFPFHDDQWYLSNFLLARVQKT